MTFAIRLSVGFAMACALAYIATPYAIALANRLDFYDRPAGYKGHGRPTPYLGGAAVMAAFLIAVLLFAGDLERTAPLSAGVAALWIVGTIDDRRTVSPTLRLLLELAFGALVWSAGLGWHLHSGAALDLTLTCLWVLAVSNAFNLFDNMDGAASTMALVVSAGAALLGAVHGEVWLAVGAASLCGACLGFLPRNLAPPARIFLGDGGSMPIGFAVAVLVMVAAGSAASAWRGLLVAVLLVGIPALDVSLVIISRRRRGVSVLSGGRDHLTHRLRTYLPSARAVALALGAIQAAISVIAVLASEGGASFIVLSASLYALAAGGAIAVLDTQQIEEFGLRPRSFTIATRALGNRAFACLLVLGLGAGLSPFAFAYYDTSQWVPIGLVLVCLCAIALVMRPARPSAPAALALAGLLGLGVWSLCSTAWAESVQSAVVSGNRWLVYGALMVLLLVLVNHERRALALLGAAALGIGVVALWVLVRLLGSDPATLFLNGRLNSPLGYINGEGCLFAMGIWPCIAAAENRRALVAGPAAALATLMACFALLSQSRGTALALAGSLIIVFALAPGRTRRAYAILAVAAGTALGAPELLRVYHDSGGGAVAPGVARAAGRAALLAAFAVGVAWALLTAGWEWIAAHAQNIVRARALGAWLLAIPAVIALALAAASAQSIERQVRTQWRAFVDLAEPGANGDGTFSATQSRLLSGAGNRYDYWRVAVGVWRERPLLGVGAGNYAQPYYERRATSEDIQQPHSLELQTLSELGLIGGLALALFIAGVAWGALRMRGRAGPSRLRRWLLVAGVGVFSAWLIQDSVDWMHLLPGLTAIALAGAAVLLWPRAASPAAVQRAPRGRRRRFGSGPMLAAGASAVIVTLIVAGASLSRQGLGELFLSRAQHEIAARPAAALREAQRSLDFDPDAAQGYYVKAAALARFDQPRAVDAVLAQALTREPKNFVTWALLGDVAVRDGQFALAKRDYGRAHELDPRDLTLHELALDPRSALR